MNPLFRSFPHTLLSSFAVAGLLGGAAFAADGLAIQGVSWAGIPAANVRAGHPDNRLASRFYLELIAQGLDPLENPSGVITHFGYLSDSDVHPVEPTKTEPDESTYLVLDHNPGGPEGGYD